jgi:hypothetical protein
MSYDTTAAPTRLIPVPDWPNHHPWPPLGGLRHLIFHADSNGFRDAFVRVGRRVLVDEARFFEAVRARRPGRAA